MKVTKFVPLFTTVVVVGFGVFVLIGDVSAGGTGTCMRKVNGVWIAEPCVSGGGGSSGSGGGSSGRRYTPSRPSPQELKRRNATKLNNIGVKYAIKGNEYRSKKDYHNAVAYYEKAITAYEEALSFDPNDQTARNNLRFAKGKRANLLGLIYDDERKDLETAIQYYREAVKYMPEAEEYQNNLSGAKDDLEWVRKKRKRKEDEQAEKRRRQEKEAAAERERQQQLAKAKTEITGILDDLSAELGASKTSIFSQTKSTDPLSFIDPNEPPSSEGTKTSSLQGLRFISVQEEKGKRDAKKLKFATLNKPEGVSATKPGDQLKSTLISGERAASAVSDEQVKGDAQLGFDTRGDYAESPLIPLSKDVGKNPWKAPVVTDADRKRIPQIREIEQERYVVRKKRVELETELEKLKSEKPKDWTVKEVEIKQKISVTEKLEQFHNYALGRLLQKNKKQTEEQAKTDK